MWAAGTNAQLVRGVPVTWARPFTSHSVALQRTHADQRNRQSWLGGSRLHAGMSGLASRPLQALAVRADPAGSRPPPKPKPSDDAIIKATGVPMVEEFCACDSMHQMATQCAYVLGSSALAAALLCLSLSALRRLAGKIEHRRLAFFPTFTRCTAGPIWRLAPIWWVFYGLMVSSAFAQVAATRQWAEFNALVCGNGPMVLRTLRVTSQLFQDVRQTVEIVGVAWIVTNYKNRLVEWAREIFVDDACSASNNMLRLLGPVSTLSGWAIVAGAVFATVQNFGVNIQPLLASIGASSVIIGLAAQSTLRNLTGAVMLYASQPFTAGDRVQLLTAGGSLVIEGPGVGPLNKGTYQVAETRPSSMGQQ